MTSLFRVGPSRRSMVSTLGAAVPPVNTRDNYILVVLEVDGEALGVASFQYVVQLPV